MRLIFAILALTDLLLLGVTAVVGLMVEHDRWFFQHFALGVLSGIYTCFVHVVAFTYFVVVLKIVRQAVLDGSAPAAVAEEFARDKSLALRFAMVAVLATLITVGLGALVTEPSYAAAWGVSTGWHLIAAFGFVGINLIAFAAHFAAIDRSTARFERTLERGAPGTEGSNAATTSGGPT